MLKRLNIILFLSVSSNSIFFYLFLSKNEGCGFSFLFALLRITNSLWRSPEFSHRHSILTQNSLQYEYEQGWYDKSLKDT